MLRLHLVLQKTQRTLDLDRFKLGHAEALSGKFFKQRKEVADIHLKKRTGGR
jgi:hypothetical protein